MHLKCDALMYVHIDITHYRHPLRFSDFIFNAVIIEQLISPSYRVLSLADQHNFEKKY